MHLPMRGAPGRRLLAAMFSALLLSALSTPAFAAEIRQGQSVVVGPNESIDDDLYAFGSTVNIQGTVNGSVYSAGGNVTISGTVTRSVFAAGGTTTINGPVRQSVHVAGGTVIISAPIGEDAVIAGGSTTIGSTAQVGRDLIAANGTATINGPVTRNVLMSAGEITLAAPVGGNVQAQVDTLRVLRGASIGGALGYSSSRDVEIAPDATVGGAVQRSQPQVRQQPGAGSIAIDWIRGLVGLTVLGLLVIMVFPRFTGRTLDSARRSPWVSLGLGFALLVGVPILAIAVLITGIIIGGWWLALLLLAAYAAALVVGYTATAVFVGRSATGLLRLSEQHTAWYLIEGLILLGFIGLVPFVGGLVALAAIVFGVGALTLAIADAYRVQPAVAPTPERVAAPAALGVPVPAMHAANV